VITRTQPKVPEAKVRGSQEGFQCVLVSSERVPEVRKGVPRGRLELAALVRAKAGVVRDVDVAEGGELLAALPTRPLATLPPLDEVREHGHRFRSEVAAYDGVGF
jgi:hypothetical protein